MTPLVVRPHKAPIIEQCPQAAFPPAVAAASGGDMARLGLAAHEFIATRIQTGEARDVATLAGNYNVDAEDLAGVVFSAWRWWVANRELFPEPQAEVGMEWTDRARGIVLKGTADIVSLVAEESAAHLCDWKSGFLDGDASAQVKCYGWLAVQNSSVQSVAAWVPRPRLGVVDAYEWTAAELAEWWEEFAGRIAAEAPFNPGPRHCRYCPRMVECPAVGGLVSASRRWFGDCSEAYAGEVVATMEAAELLELHSRIGLVEDAADICRRLLRAEVGARALRGEEVKAGGWSLRLTDHKRREINVASGWPVLRQALGDRLPEVLRLSKTEAEAIVKKAAGRGKGAAAVRELMEKLGEAEAIQTTIVEKLELRKVVGDGGGTKAIHVGDGGEAGDDGAG